MKYYLIGLNRDELARVGDEGFHLRYDPLAREWVRATRPYDEITFEVATREITEAEAQKVMLDLSCSVIG